MRSNFPKDLDLDLPTSPLGSLWIPNGTAGNSHGSDGGDDANCCGNPGGKQVPGQGGDVTVRAAKAGSVDCSPGVARSARDYVGRGSTGERSVDAEDSRESGGGNGEGGTLTEKKKEKRKTGTARTGARVTEIDYCGMLNRVLPPDIRALAWAPVTEDFSARFSCSDRTYRRAAKRAREVYFVRRSRDGDVDWDVAFWFRRVERFGRCGCCPMFFAEPIHVRLFVYEFLYSGVC